MTYYAHSLAGRPEREWQLLDEHLENSANLAEGFAGAFAPGWGHLAGLWHDAGKYRSIFQEYIRSDPEAHVRGSVDHSTVGALIARERNAPALAFAVAGHHGGIPNHDELMVRLQGKADLLGDARRGGLPGRTDTPALPDYPEWLKHAADRAALSLWTRFIFSALVDADFLDTERFYAGGTERDLGRRPALSELKSRLDGHLVRKSGSAPSSPINEMRRRVLDACRRAAESQPGAFTLTVPTGGGKTLASLAFALDHAVRHGLQRVIVVIPYTSIIEQTAEQYRIALGQDSVLEHHTNVDPKNETRESRLASENWDAPVVVTTSVQFFESLYANKPARCRKLHRVVRSVVVFDEVQTFPANLLAPVRAVLKELTSHYGSTALLCTATQPALLEHAREVVPDPDREFAVVAGRCQVVVPQTDVPVTWEALAADVRCHSQAMVIVHRRDDAQVLAELVGDDCLHLSARMCAAHRSVVLGEVKRRLGSGERCLLVATQLVEAGVDVDFPSVYRAMAGADSLAQAAGRCNREGRGNGVLKVFIAPTRPPRGILRTAEGVASVMHKEGRLVLTSPGTFREYFARLYGLSETDTRNVLALERSQNFEDVARAFEMIPETGAPVVAPYGDWQEHVEQVRRFGISRDRMRRLQRFLVSLHQQEVTQLQQAGAVERIADSFWAVVPGYRVYDQRLGFGWQGSPLPEPESLIA